VSMFQTGRARWIDCPQTTARKPQQTTPRAGSRYQQYFPYLWRHADPRVRRQSAPRAQKTFQPLASYRLDRVRCGSKSQKGASLWSATGTRLRFYASVVEANAQKRTRPRVGIGRPPSPPPLFSIVSVITADTPVDANSIHSTDIAPELVRTIEAGSSRPFRPRAGASGSTTTLGAGRIPSSVLINAPLALTLSRRPRHLQPLSGDCIQLSRTGMFVESRCPQRCSIDLSLELCRWLCCIRLGHAAIRNSPYAMVHRNPAEH
jgi:hypothetical protein